MNHIQMAEELVYQAVLNGEMEIDSQGRIWRIAVRRGNRWRPGTTLIPCMRRRAEHLLPSGYLQIRTMVDKKRTNALAHRLVYRHFKGPIPDGKTINHHNGKKGDNRPDNLSPATYTEQVQHARQILKVGKLDQWGEKNPAKKLSARQVIEIRQRREHGEKLFSIAQDFGIAFQTVSKIAHKQRRSRG